ncbi:MAG: YaiI/YqxD family protein, partial [Gammaproteobacteria bacterium]|nr:YaiI/YqxD family protein [Gammaproteobacteria bacterium]
MKIWIDADACPVVIKDILFRAAQRTGIQLTLVANQVIKTPPSRYIQSIQV